MSAQANEPRTSTSYFVPPDEPLTKPETKPKSERETARLQKITDRFIAGLKKHNLTYEQITSSDWRYCGGDDGAAARYYAVACPDEKHPEHATRCVCGHPINKNFYINNINTKQILILGMCCIRKFIPKCYRTCSECGAKHRNTKKNLCNLCQTGLCRECNQPKWNTYYKSCYDCWYNK